MKKKLIQSKTKKGKHLMATTTTAAVPTPLMAVSALNPTPLRETPAVALLVHAPDDPAFPNVGNPANPDTPFEETLALDVIQGNVIDGGFNKDFQTILCLEISDATRFKVWLKAQIPFISRAAEVLTFNRLFKTIRKRHGEPVGLKATWVSISFSFQAVTLLTNAAEAAKFLDQAFKDGLAAHSQGLGDPTAAAAEGNPANWVVGGPQQEAHVLMLVAADDRGDMLTEVARIEESLFNLRDQNGQHVPSGAQLIFREEGANLPAPLGGHEHFGNLDGISQPGVRGRISADPNDVLTPRQNSEKIDQHGNRTQGKPGQDLLWPGEFVFGYPAQEPLASSLEDSKGAVKKAVDGVEPHWTDNGSYLVFRRLRQDVAKFHQFLNYQAPALNTNPLLVSSKLVGRWESGAPTVRNPDVDNPAMGNDDCANNDFEFNRSDDPKDSKHGPNDCQDNFPDDPKDDATNLPPDNAATGKRCPFIAHTRKSYPRNDLTPGGGKDGEIDKRIGKSEATTQTHRMLRRGIPYGSVSPSTPAEPIADTEDRGLHFLAYQTSIVNQFEFVTKNWVNNPNFSTQAATGHECGGVLPLGHDPIIGQSNNNGNRTRQFFIELTDDAGTERCEQLTAPEDWVIPTGGGYFFTPSIDALKSTLT
jgi:Dyp-type peroxidase family